MVPFLFTDAAGRAWEVIERREPVPCSIEFCDDGRRQTINWEWRPRDQWLPLCDRVATREDNGEFAQTTGRPTWQAPHEQATSSLKREVVTVGAAYLTSRQVRNTVAL